MGGASPLLWLGAALGVSGVAVLRYAWSLAKRSPLWNAIGWALLLAATIAGGVADGAWGVTIAALFAMSAAMIALAVAGARAPQGRAAASNRRVGLLPESGEPKRIGRRFATFALVILGGFAASLALALAVRGIGSLLGWHAADANALALFTVPLAWAVIATIMLMQTRRAAQAKTLAISALPVLPVLITGALA